MVMVENIRKRFNGRDVLDGVSMSIGVGKAVALIGPSGSGKTTLIRTINGFVVPDSGRVIMGGKAINYNIRNP
jgi:ABC-type Fe3+/spermidine/putrescine transport system ATPase subunit